MDTERHEHPPSFWKSPAGLALCVVGAVAAYFLFTEHRAHLAGWLPYAFLAACPLMHIFMHHGHGHGGHQRPQDTPPAADGNRPTP